MANLWAMAEANIAARSRAGRWVLAATVLGSGMAFLDSTVVNVALPRIGRDFGVGLADLQWTATAYTLTLSAFLLLGGALGDRYGRRRIFVIGLTWFAIASLLCAVAPSAPVLIAARAVQGVGGALLTPGSLAIIEATFRPGDRGAVIGSWSGFSALFGAVGPLLGGVLVQTTSWRLVFFINLPVAVAAGFIAVRHVPETMRAEGHGRLDVQGPVLAALALGGITYGLIEGSAGGWRSAADIGTLIAGFVLLAAFFVVEARQRDPLLPLGIFRSRVFSGANAATFVIYGALGGVSFLVVLQLQDVLGYSPVAAGVSLLPLTLMLLLLSSRSGRLAAAIGPRIPMTAGPLLAGVGMAMFARIVPGSAYATTVLPAAIIFGLGMTLTVPALTSTALGAVPSDRAGIASAVNNDVARVAGLVAVAVIPALAGVPTGGNSVGSAALQAGFPTAMYICAALCALGGLVAFLTIPGRLQAKLGGDPLPSCALPPSIAVPVATFSRRVPVRDRR